MLRALVARHRARKLRRMWDDAIRGTRAIDATLKAAGADRALRRRVQESIIKGHVMPPELSALVKGAIRW